MSSRRRYLALVGAISVPLAGCSSQQEAEFLVTDVQVVHQPGHRTFDYPEDILYRVSVENTGPNRQSGVLELTLRYDPDDGNESTAGEEMTWSRTEDISLSRGTSVEREFVFEDVYQEGHEIDAYHLDATIRSN